MPFPQLICEFRPGAGPLEAGTTAPEPVHAQLVSGTSTSFIDTPSTTPTAASDLDLRWGAGGPDAAGFGRLVGPDGYEQHSDLNSDDFVVGALASLELDSADPTGTQTFLADPSPAPMSPRHGFTVTVQSSPQPASVHSVATATHFGPTFTVARPARAVAGDLLFAFHSSDVGVLTDMTISGGATWALLDDATGGTDAFHTRIWWRVARRGEPRTYDLTQNASADGVVTVVAVRGAAIDDLAWVDISDRLRSGEPEEGRDDEFEQFPAAQATLLLDNRDRALDPEFAAGPWFGQLQPRTPFRLRTAAQDLYYGFVEGGFEQVPRPPAQLLCLVALTDLLEVLQGIPLPGGAYQSEVLADAPVAWWTLDETDGFMMGDSSGQGHDGSYVNGEQGEDPLVAGDGHSFRVPQASGNYGLFQGESLPTGPPFTFEAWVRFPRDTSQAHYVFTARRDFTRFDRLRLYVPSSSPNGELQILMIGPREYRGSSSVDNDRIHHVAVVIESDQLESDLHLYVDGVEDTLTNVQGSGLATWTNTEVWALGNSPAVGINAGVDGLLDEAAVYDHALTATRVSAHHEAGVTAFAGERAGHRIQRVLDIVGVPGGLRDVADGDTTVGPAAYDGRSAGDYLAGVVESEQGFFYVDHHDGGRIKFRGRYARFTEPRSTAVQAAFTDEDLPGALHYERDGLTVDPNGIDSLVNQADVSWPGGTVRVEDVDSTARFGPQSRSVATEAPSRRAAASSGKWLVSRYSQPQVRVRGIELDPAADDRLWTAALDLRTSDLVTVRRHPQVLGDPITNELFVEGVSHDVEGVRWRTSVRLSSADLGDVWIWGTSAWGVDAIWG